MSTPELHYKVGRYVSELESRRGAVGISLLGAAYRNAVPIFVSSPGDSSIGMNVAALALEGRGPLVDVNKDVNLSAGDRLRRQEVRRQDARAGSSAAAAPRTSCCRPSRTCTRCSASPRPDTTSSCSSPTRDPTPADSPARHRQKPCRGARSIPTSSPSTVVAYVDSTIALPILTHYVLANVPKRKPRRLVDRLDQILAQIAAGRGELGPAQESD